LTGDAKLSLKGEGLVFSAPSVKLRDQSQIIQAEKIKLTQSDYIQLQGTDALLKTRVLGNGEKAFLPVGIESKADVGIVNRSSPAAFSIGMEKLSEPESLPFLWKVSSLNADDQEAGADVQFSWTQAVEPLDFGLKSLVRKEGLDWLREDGQEMRETSVYLENYTQISAEPSAFTISKNPPVLNIDILTDDGQTEELFLDVATGLYFVERIIPEGDKQVASFVLPDDVVLVLERSGDRDDLSLFELIFENAGGRIDNSQESEAIFNMGSRTLNSALRSVSVVFREQAKAGSYQVMLTATDQFAYRTSVLISVKVLAEIIAVLPLEDSVELEWGSTADIPNQQRVLTSDGQTFLLDVELDERPLNRFRRGDYVLSGKLLLPDFLRNSALLEAGVMVRVQPKPAPRNVSLNKSSFKGSTSEFFIPVGDFVVEDPADAIYVVSLFGEGYDNRYFQVNSNVLYWNSAERAEGRTKFSILVRVLDRDGNTIERFLEITRERPASESIPISNTFTPNNDGSNDTWGVPDLRYYQGVRIQVFDRGGDRMFYTEDPDVRWDGTYRGRELPIGTYYWTIEVREAGEVRKGMLNLLRK